MSKELEQLKEIFLSDVDQETYEDNLKIITEWERELVENESFKEWQEHDITQKVMNQFKDAYVEMSMSLARGRTLTEQQRIGLFAKIDALSWFLSVVGKDAKQELEQLQNTIRARLSATS